MRSQFILIFILMISLGLIFFINSFRNVFSYPYDLSKYILEDFKVKLLLYDPSIVNQTYYSLCQEYGFICYYNGTHIIYSYNLKTVYVPIMS